MAVVFMTRMTEKEIEDYIDTALSERQFVIYIQPQFNHSNKSLVGGEALVRWFHPQNGMQFPNDFIPVFENKGLIHKLDLYVFEEVCIYQRKCLDNCEATVPISFNISRADLRIDDYVDQMETIRLNYDIPVKLLRIEITESCALDGSERMINIIEKLHKIGYIVEMDDFGSGYSSLNVLKDLEVDVIKLDLKFFSGSVGGRGGIIINSVVNLAKWLSTPIIAEGVETQEQADYMLSIGSEYIQGYFYSKPIPADEFHELVNQKQKQNIKEPAKFIQNMDTKKFWDPHSFETLIFSNYVGGAAIFTYNDKEKELEVIRVNKKYIAELSMNVTEKQLLKADPWIAFNAENRAIYENTLLTATELGKEVHCETWRTFSSECCGDERLCIRSSIQLLGEMENKKIFYAQIRNITNEKKMFQDISESEKKFRTASEQINVYAWEYVFATKEMHPCFRCMRDLGIPATVHNYPDPLFEIGMFPMDYKDMYMDWLRQLENGLESIEGIIPLTVGRVPFMVRYTTEFDEGGRPVKAYGSATPAISLS